MRVAAVLFFVLSLGFALANIADAQVTAPSHCCVPNTTATPSPTPFPDYVWTGTNTQIYGATAGVGDPQANAIVGGASPLPTDPNSAAVMAAQGTNNILAANSESQNYVPNVNASPTAVPSVVVTATPGGHQPPITLNTANGKGGAGATIPWSYTGFYLENLCQANCTSDNHWLVMDPVANLMFQGDGGNTDGATFFASYTGIIDSSNLSYCAQVGDKSDNFTVAGLPGFGFILFSDDINAVVNSGTSINHPTGIVVAINSVASGSAGVNLSQISTNNVGTCSANCLQFGDIIRLKASYNCATAGGGDAATVAVCVSWQRYGRVVVDLGALPAVHSGLTAGTHTDSVTATMYNWWHTLNWATDSELVQRGSVHC
jgi:hypothetical protein